MLMKHGNSAGEDKDTDIFSDFTSATVRLHLPKFKSETTIDLKEILTNMGMGSAFDINIADFTNFWDGKELLYIKCFTENIH